MDIVLTTEQKNALETLRENAPGMFKAHSNFSPIEIETKDANGEPCYIIPYKLLEDPDFELFKNYVFDNLTTTIEIRIVDKSELKKYILE